MNFQRLLVSYGLGLTVTVLLVACQNSPALQANAGTDFDLTVGEAPTFDGCASTGDIVNYQWTIISAPGQMSGDAGKVIREVDTNCSFTLDAEMGVDEVGTWTIELTVSDAQGNTSRDTMQVDVIP